jgi:hypothetical protein
MDSSSERQSVSRKHRLDGLPYARRALYAHMPLVQAPEQHFWLQSENSELRSEVRNKWRHSAGNLGHARCKRSPRCEKRVSKY